MNDFTKRGVFFGVVALLRLAIDYIKNDFFRIKLRIFAGCFAKSFFGAASKKIVVGANKIGIQRLALGIEAKILLPDIVDTNHDLYLSNQQCKMQKVVSGKRL